MITTTRTSVNNSPEAITIDVKAYNNYWFTTVNPQSSIYNIFDALVRVICLARISFFCLLFFCLNPHTAFHLMYISTCIIIFSILVESLQQFNPDFSNLLRVNLTDISFLFLGLHIRVSLLRGKNHVIRNRYSGFLLEEYSMAPPNMSGTIYNGSRFDASQNAPGAHFIPVFSYPQPSGTMQWLRYMAPCILASCSTCLLWMAFILRHAKCTVLWTIHPLPCRMHSSVDNIHRQPCKMHSSTEIIHSHSCKMQFYGEHPLPSMHNEQFHWQHPPSNMDNAQFHGEHPSSNMENAQFHGDHKLPTIQNTQFHGEHPLPSMHNEQFHGHHPPSNMENAQFHGEHPPPAMQNAQFDGDHPLITMQNAQFMESIHPLTCRTHNAMEIIHPKLCTMYSINPLPSWIQSPMYTIHPPTMQNAQFHGEHTT